MKRAWLITIIICLVLLGGGGAVLLLPQVVPFDQCSDVYKRYADMDGVDATFIKDYKVNDTVTVRATLLETKDTTLWDSMCCNFGISLFSMYPKEYREGMSLEHSFGQHIIIDTNVANQGNVNYKTLVVFSHLNKSMCIFHDIDDLQYNAIINKKHKDITL